MSDTSPQPSSSFQYGAPRVPKLLASSMPGTGSPILDALAQPGGPPQASAASTPSAPSDPTADIAAYANLPSDQQAGGANFLPPAGTAPPAPPPRSAVSQALDAVLMQGAAKHLAAGAAPASDPGQGFGPFPAAQAPALPAFVAPATSPLQLPPATPSPFPGGVGGAPSAQSPAPWKPGFFDTEAQYRQGMSWADAQDAAIARHNAMSGALPFPGGPAAGGAAGPSNYQPSMAEVQSYKTPANTWGDAANAARSAYYDQAGRAIAMDSMASMGRALSGQAPGQGGGPAPGQGGGGGAPAPGSPGSPFPAATAPLAMPGVRTALAMSAYMHGQAKDAAEILSDKVVIGPDGQPYDEKTGGLVGPRMAKHEIVNGQDTDLGDPANAGRFYPTYNAEDQPTFDQYGRPVGVAPLPGSVAGAAARTRATSNATNASEAAYAGRKAFGAAAGTGAGSALTDVVSAPDGQGGSTQMTRAQYLAALNGNAGGGPAGAGGRGGLGRTPSPADQEYDKNQATAASTELNSDLDARQSALQDRDNARQALSYVQAHKMDQASPHIAAGAAYLRTLPASVLQSVGANPKDIDRAANDPAVYQRLSSQNLLSFSKSNLPSRYTEREMAVAGKVIPQLSTPNDAAAMHWGLQAAIANKALQRAQFAAGYSGPKTRQGVEQTWMNTQPGQASLFEDPVWKGVTLGGKPAVVYTRKGGRTYGIVGAGTGSPTTFLASGQ